MVAQTCKVGVYKHHLMHGLEMMVTFSKLMQNWLRQVSFAE
jgi:hypothetical protein